MTTPAAPKSPPYPADTKAKGWRFELDYEQIEQSATWALAGPEGRPWLLMMWMTAWRQVPCGSMPADEEVIVALIGMPAKMWAKHRKALMRGWSLADDGLLYHPTVSTRVLEMLEYRRKNAERVAKFKAAKREERKGNALPTREQQGSNDTGTGTGTNTSVPKGTGGKPPTNEEIIFSYGLGLLTNAGTPEKQARTFLGGLRKGRDDSEVVNALRDCIRAKPLQPLEWLAAALPPAGGKSKPNAQEALEAQNRAVAERFLAKDMTDVAH